MTYRDRITTIEHAGLSFGVSTAHDHDHGAPWDENDGHGPVREASYRGYRYPTKEPGERVLWSDRGDALLYDYAGAMKLAERDGWGLSPEATAKLAAKLGRAPKAGEIRAQAVEHDFNYLRGYANGDWSYVGVIVTLLDTDGDDTDESESLWGVESSCSDYINETAAELAEQLADRIGDAVELVLTFRIREAA